MRRLIVPGLVVASLLGGCYTGAARSFSPARFEHEPGWISVPSVPVLRQEGERNCGASVIAMLLRYWGIPASEAEIRAASGVPPAKGLPAEFLRTYLRGRGLDAFLFEGTFSDFEHELQGGRPVVVGVLRPFVQNTYAHYQLIVGINQARQEVVVIDPADGWRVYPFEGFVREWKPTQFLTMAVSPATP
jgi:ABC-type bacteriocin/lantibiotic exporter with double-glycine peptidase domain